MPRDREEMTIRAMVEIYCRRHHETASGLCAPCAALLKYAQERLNRCLYGDEKPVCSKCPVHCYRPEQRERIQAVMRYAGPKMLVHHPFLSISHFAQKRKPIPK